MKVSVGLIQTIRGGGTNVSTSTSTTGDFADSLQLLENLKKRQGALAELDFDEDKNLEPLELPGFESHELAEEHKPKYKIVDLLADGSGGSKPKEIQYVRIDGKYYPAREDNIYIVKGERIHFINNRRYTADEVNGAPNRKTAGADPMEQAKEVLKQGKSKALLPMSADSDELLQQMMQTQEAIKNNRKQLDQFLEE